MKRALLVGVDEYDSFSGLAGCANDVAALNPLLSRNEDGSPNFDCQLLSTRATRDQFLGHLDALFAGGADVALLYFAGHGDGRGTDVALATSDGTQHTPGIAMSEILAKIADSTVGEVVVILDCCFAGSAGGIPQLASPDAALRAGLTILAASRGDQTAAETPDARGLFSTFLCGALEGGAADVLGKITVAGL